MRTLPLALLAALLASSLGCDKEPSKAEKLADDMVKQKAAASAEAKASAAVVDPKEEKYKAARAAVKDRATAQMRSLENLYQTPTDADKAAFREFFAPTEEGKKDAEEVAKEALQAAKATKMMLKKWEITDVNLDPTQTTATVDVSVEELQAAKISRCVLYKTDWKEFAGKWHRVARREFRIVACPQ